MRMNALPSTRRLQLWSDQNQENFAIRLSSELTFKTASNPAASYTVLADEGEFLDDLEYNWSYLLDHWVRVKKGEIKIVDAEVGQTEIYPAGRLDGKAQEEKPKQILKCHYCRLSYGSEKDRRRHEAIWHAEKVKMAL